MKANRKASVRGQIAIRFHGLQDRVYLKHFFADNRNR